MDTIRKMFSSSDVQTPAPVYQPTHGKHYPSPNTEKYLSTVGYYFDFSQPPIAGRPVINNYNKYIKPAPRMNLANREFKCQQPAWTENCY